MKSSAGAREILIDLDGPMETVLPSQVDSPEEPNTTGSPETVIHEFNMPNESEQQNQNGGNL